MKHPEISTHVLERIVERVPSVFTTDEAKAWLMDMWPTRRLLHSHGTDRALYAVNGGLEYRLVARMENGLPTAILTVLYVTDVDPSEQLYANDEALPEQVRVAFDEIRAERERAEQAAAQADALARAAQRWVAAEGSTSVTVRAAVSDLQREVARLKTVLGNAQRIGMVGDHVQANITLQRRLDNALLDNKRLTLNNESMRAELARLRSQKGRAA